MIREAIDKKPFIHFGFNKQSITVNTNEDVIVWQDTIYFSGYFDASITSVGATQVEIGRNKSILKFDTAGTYTIRFNVSDKSKTFTNTSNILTIIVNDLMYGSTEKVWGNTQITFA